MVSRTEFFSLLMDIMCCTMVADRRISDSEIRSIGVILKELKAPWSVSTIKSRFKEFTQKARTKGVLCLIHETVNQAQAYDITSEESDLILKCIDRVIHADGFIDPLEIEVLQKFKAALVRDKSEPLEFDIDEEIESWTYVDRDLQTLAGSISYSNRSSPSDKKLSPDNIRLIRTRYEDECNRCRAKADRESSALDEKEVLSNLNFASGRSTEDIVAAAFGAAFRNFDLEMQRADERAFELIMKEHSLTRDKLRWILSEEASQLLANQSGRSNGDCEGPHLVRITSRKNSDDSVTFTPIEISSAIPRSCPNCYNALQNVTSKGHDAEWQMAMQFIERGVFIQYSQLVLQCGYCSNDMVVFQRNDGPEKLTLTLT